MQESLSGASFAPAQRVPFILSEGMTFNLGGEVTSLFLSNVAFTHHSQMAGESPFASLNAARWHIGVKRTYGVKRTFTRHLQHLF